VTRAETLAARALNSDPLVLFTAILAPTRWSGGECPISGTRPKNGRPKNIPLSSVFEYFKQTAPLHFLRWFCKTL